MQTSRQQYVEVPREEGVAVAGVEFLAVNRVQVRLGLQGRPQRIGGGQVVDGFGYERPRQLGSPTCSSTRTTSRIAANCASFSVSGWGRCARKCGKSVSCIRFQMPAIDLPPSALPLLKLESGHSGQVSAVFRLGRHGRRLDRLERRRPVAQGAVRSSPIIVLSPPLHQHLRRRHRVEELLVETLIPQLAVAGELPSFKVPLLELESR